MKVQTWHIPISQKVSFEEIKKQLLGKGSVSVVDEAGKVFHKYTEPLKITIPFPTITIASSDLLSSQNGNALCYVELVEESPQTQQLNLVMVSKDQLTESQLLADCQSVFSKQEAVRGTTREGKIVKSLEGRVKEGPHKKLLSIPEFASSLETLCDPVIRKPLRAFMDIFGDSTVSRAYIDDILPKRGELKKSETHRLLNNEDLFSKQFSIGCSKCGVSTLVFPTKAEAQESLSHSASHKCFMCGENTLEAVEAFGLKEAVLKGLGQGLWLEYLVHQVVQPDSIFSVPGVASENFEIDVVSVICESVILFECKDTSFGERDFWMSVPKAQTVDADILWIVTTEPLHENVRRTIERQKRQVRFEIFITENFTDQQGITNDLSQKLEQVQDSFLRRLFTRERELYAWQRNLLRRPLRFS